MNLKNSVLASYASQIYVTLIGILLVPMYVRYMGAEAYGLVGFFAMLQACFQLLDMGLTPTMARQTARFRGGAGDAAGLRQLLRTLEGIFVVTAVLGAAVIVTAAGFIASDWLKVQRLPLDDVRMAVMLIGVTVALRWLSGLYRGAITGFEHIIWLSGFGAVIATARFVLVIPFFIYVSVAPVEFFVYQVAVALFEVVVLAAKTYALLPKVGGQRFRPWVWTPIKPVLQFSLSIAFTSSVWVAVTQVDKLILSKLLPLSEYAYFTLAVLLASGVGIVVGPISGVLLPRMANVVARGGEQELFRLYRNATQGVCAVAVPAALVLAFFGKQVLWAWTGDAAISEQASKVMGLYALGNGVLAIAAFPYYLQFAKGDLKLHFVGHCLLALLLIPSLVVATIHYGIAGAGYAWLGANALYLCLWVPKVHRKFAPGLHVQWLMKDIGPIVAATLLAAAAIDALVPWPQDRLHVAAQVAAVGAILGLAGMSASSLCRELLITRLRGPVVKA